MRSGTVSNRGVARSTERQSLCTTKCLTSWKNGELSAPRPELISRWLVRGMRKRSRVAHMVLGAGRSPLCSLCTTLYIPSGLRTWAASRKSATFRRTWIGSTWHSGAPSPCTSREIPGRRQFLVSTPSNPCYAVSRRPFNEQAADCRSFGTRVRNWNTFNEPGVYTFSGYFFGSFPVIYRYVLFCIWQ